MSRSVVPKAGVKFWVRGGRSTPATPPRAPARPHVSMATRLRRIPMSRAAVGSWLVARVASPRSVRPKNQARAAPEAASTTTMKSSCQETNTPNRRKAFPETRALAPNSFPWAPARNWKAMTKMATAAVATSRVTRGRLARGRITSRSVNRPVPSAARTPMSAASRKGTWPLVR